MTFERPNLTFSDPNQDQNVIHDFKRTIITCIGMQRENYQKDKQEKCGGKKGCLVNMTPQASQVEILLRSCKILQESCKILIKIKILIRSCLTFKILKNLSKNLVRS